MAKKLDSIVELAAQKTREISANSGNYMAFLTTAAHNFKYDFRDQLLIYAQKPDAPPAPRSTSGISMAAMSTVAPGGSPCWWTRTGVISCGMSLICPIPIAVRGAPSPSGRWSRGMRTR